MSNTGKVHARFWTAMQQRYGIRRWNELYGENISPSWRELIDRFTPDDVKGALAQLPKQAPDFPPTLPQFEAILTKLAQSKRIDSTDYLRGYWRSFIVFEMENNLGYRFESSFEDVLRVQPALAQSMRSILDDICDMELRTGQRTDGMHLACRDKCADLAENFEDLETGTAFQRALREKRPGRRCDRRRISASP